MLSIKALKLGDEDYYLDLAEDYYFGGTEPAGQWIGGGCKYLGLSGKVNRDAFKRVFRGYHPHDGGGPEAPDQWIPLVQSAGKPNHQPGWDLTFSAPKSFSVMWSQAPEEIRKEFEDLHFEAVKSAVDFVELNFAFSRTGKAGHGGLVPVKLVVSAFEHGTSRAVQPQVHFHALAHNIGVDDRDPTHPKFRTIVSKLLYQHKMVSGAFYRAKLAHLMHAKYGFKAERKRNEFDFIGVPEDLLDAHSTRSKEIAADLDKRGASGAKAAEQSALLTRRKKGKKQFPREMLFPEWQKTNAMYGFDARSLNSLIRPPKANYDYARFLPKILKQASKDISRNRNHFTIYEFLREALYAAPEFGVSPDLLLDAVEKYLHDSPDIIPIPFQNRYTTKAILKQEMALLNAVKKLKARKGTHVTDKILSSVLARHSRLNEQQRAAVKHLTQGDAAIRIVQGYAGVGKTTMLRAAVEAWKQQGYSVVGACFTGAAAEQLQAEIGIPCDTITMTLADLNSEWSDYAMRYLKHTARQLMRAARKKSTYLFGKPKRPKINRKSIVLLDEAGMINTRHMRMLTEWAETHNATIALVGDPAQLAAIEGGSPLQSLSNRVGYAEVTEIQRQKDEWARTAAHCMATGKIAQAMSLYAERNLVTVRPDMEQAMMELIEQWTHYAYDRPERAAILALTNKQVQQANELAQQRRLEKGVLDPKKSRRIVSQDKKTGKSYKSQVHINDRVVFRQTNRTYKVRRGNVGTVIGFTHYKGLHRPAIRVRLDKGAIVTVPLSFRHIRLGYASTVHRAQGDTIPTVFVLAGGPSQNLPITYVEGTRSQEATRFFTDQTLYDELQQDIKESELVAQMQRQVDLSLASDLFTPALANAATRHELVDSVLEHSKQHLAASDGPAVIIAPTKAEAEAINKRCVDINIAMAQIDSDTKRRLAQLYELKARPMPQESTPKRGVSATAQVDWELAAIIKEVHRQDVQQRAESPPKSTLTWPYRWENHPPPAPSFLKSTDTTWQKDRYRISDHLGNVVYVTLAEYESWNRLMRLRAIDWQEAYAQAKQVQNAYILPVDTESTVTSPYSAARYEPVTITSPTVFQTPIATQSFGVQAQNTFLFTQQQQMAADWQQKMAQVNQQTPWYIQQQQYLNQITSQQKQVEIQHKYGI